MAQHSQAWRPNTVKVSFTGYRLGLQSQDDPSRTPAASPGHAGCKVTGRCKGLAERRTLDT